MADRRRVTTAGSTWVLRAAAQTDLADVCRVVEEAYGVYVARLGYRPPPMDADYAAAIADGHAYVAEVDRAVAGVLVLVEEADVLLLENFALSLAVQGRGWGSRLLGFAEDEARRRGMSSVRLYTNLLMTENQRLYRQRGYAETHRSTDGPVHRVHFSKAL